MRSAPASAMWSSSRWVVASLSAETYHSNPGRPRTRSIVTTGNPSRSKSATIESSRQGSQTMPPSMPGRDEVRLARRRRDEQQRMLAGERRVRRGDRVRHVDVEAQAPPRRLRGRVEGRHDEGERAGAARAERPGGAARPVVERRAAAMTRSRVAGGDASLAVERVRDRGPRDPRQRRDLADGRRPSPWRRRRCRPVRRRDDGQDDRATPRSRASARSRSLPSRP